MRDSFWLSQINSNTKLKLNNIMIKFKFVVKSEIKLHPKNILHDK